MSIRSALAAVLSIACASEDNDEACFAGGCDVGRWPLRVRYGGVSSVYGGHHLAGWMLEHGGFDSIDPTSDDWDLLWTSQPQVGALNKQGPLAPRDGRLRMHNHCAYFKGAGQKCHFAGHVRRVYAALQKADAKKAERFTYLRNLVLNHKDQYSQWQEEASANPEKPWVWKICNKGMSTGVEILRGEELLQRARQPKPTAEQWTVVQEYLQDPFMGFGQRKFHLRVYVVVTQWHPAPRVHIFNEGVVFRSRHEYNPGNLSTSRDVFSMIRSDIEALPHTSLWNHIDAEALAGRAAKNSTAVREHMVEAIADLFGYALEQSCGSTAAFGATLQEAGYGCFDLFGFDVMFNTKLEPIILEVNTGPNLDIDNRGEEASGLLKDVKGPLIQQLARFLALRVQSPSTGKDIADIEIESLENFTRAL